VPAAAAAGRGAAVAKLAAVAPMEKRRVFLDAESDDDDDGGVGMARSRHETLQRHGAATAAPANRPAARVAGGSGSGGHNGYIYTRSSISKF